VAKLGEAGSLSSKLFNPSEEGPADGELVVLAEGDTVALGIGGLLGTRGYGKGLDRLGENNAVCLATSGASNVNFSGEEGFGVFTDTYDPSVTLTSPFSGACLRDKVDEDGKDSGESGPREEPSIGVENAGDDTDRDDEGVASSLSDD
jgi:hypothetical protein